MFHAGVNRCYCSSGEVARRAALDDLISSQIHGPEINIVHLLQDNSQADIKQGLTLCTHWRLSGRVNASPMVPRCSYHRDIRKLCTWPLTELAVRWCAWYTPMAISE
jgi:hypothetical protein